MTEALTVIPKNEIIPAEPLPLMERLISAAAGGMDIALIERFMALAEKQEKREAEKAFNLAFSEFKANPPEIVKDKLVGFGNTKYKHATIGNVVSAIIGGMSKHGLSHRWKISQDGSVITVTCIIAHSMGHIEETAISAGADISGGKNAIQAIASTITYLERYSLQAATGIAVLEDDDDGHGAEDIEQPPKGNKQGKQEDKKASQVKPEHVADRKIIEPWLEWIDKFTSSTLDAFLVQWDEHGEAAVKAMPEHFSKELLLAKGEMEKFLMEKVAE